MNDFELGWLVGIIDGEGSITIDKRKNGWRYPVISVASTDRAIVEECKRITGAGTITVRNRNPKYKPSWAWRANGSAQVLQLIHQIALHLKCPKKAKRAKHIALNYIVTPNGHYTEEQKVLKVKFEKDFFEL